MDTTKDKIALKQKIWKDTHPDQELPVKDKEALSIRFAKKQINKAYDRIKFLESTAQRTKDALNKKIEEKTAALNVVKQAIVELQKTDPENQHSFSLKLLNCKSKRIQKQIDKAISKRDADPTKISIKSKVADLDIEFQKANLELERKHTLACIKAVKKYDKRSNRLIARAKRNEIELSKIAVPAEYSKFVDSAKLIDEINANEIAVKSKWDELKTNNRNKLLNGVNPWAPVEQPVEVVEAKEKAPAEKANAPKGLDPNKKYQVLVLCLGAGSSAVLANAINAGLKQAKITNIKAAALAWGSHESALGSADLVILSPQLGSHANNLSKQAAVKGYKLIACRGRDYIELSKNPKSAVETVVNELTKE